MILYVNCCVRQESRTDELAHEVIRLLGGDYEEVKLSEENLLPLSRERLDRRTRLLEAKAYDDPMFDYARQFAAADIIVIAAPFWDLSFPAKLKLYVENIYATGIVSEYDGQGRPRGLCRARMLYYVTTAGGPYVPEYSYDYFRELAKVYLGIKETRLIKAEMLDIVGNDPKAILAQAKKEIKL